MVVHRQGLLLRDFGFFFLLGLNGFFHLDKGGLVVLQLFLGLDELLRQRLRLLRLGLLQDGEWLRGLGKRLWLIKVYLQAGEGIREGRCHFGLLRLEQASRSHRLFLYRLALHFFRLFQQRAKPPLVHVDPVEPHHPI